MTWRKGKKTERRDGSRSGCRIGEIGMCQGIRGAQDQIRKKITCEKRVSADMRVLG